MAKQVPMLLPGEAIAQRHSANQTVNKSIPYHHWVEWSDEDDAFIGYCPDLFMGGACHASDEAKAYTRLIAAIREELADLVAGQIPMPRATVRPMRELATASL